MYWVVHLHYIFHKIYKGTCYSGYLVDLVILYCTKPQVTDSILGRVSCPELNFTKLFLLANDILSKRFSIIAQSQTWRKVLLHKINICHHYLYNTNKYKRFLLVFSGSVTASVEYIYSLLYIFDTYSYIASMYIAYCTHLNELICVCLQRELQLLSVLISAFECSSPITMASAYFKIQIDKISRANGGTIDKLQAPCSRPDH